MSFMEPVVEQDSYTGVAEQAFRRFRVNPRGELVVPDWMTQLAMDGRVFNASNPVQETNQDISTTARGTDNVSPALLLDVPASTVAFPLYIMLMPISQTTDEAVTVSINTDDGVRYSSGGQAVTPLNMRKDDPVTSACSFYNGSTAITAIANVDDDTIWAALIPAGDVPAVSGTRLPLIWTAKEAIPPMLVGPASMLIFVTSATADTLFRWSVQWAEFSTSLFT